VEGKGFMEKIHSMTKDKYVQKTTHWCPHCQSKVTINEIHTLIRIPPFARKKTKAKVIRCSECKQLIGSIELLEECESCEK
jgi:uncharacterized CHY-type Zn-finger protein